ncbi:MULTISPECIES: hypothetical protein [Haloarcula]|uniref:hypothetical protein n=1 Tax=Haloarcula TaxID=2237 RepID=UPI0023E8DC54|nr:hypothetical protein [Halomicroarcula sp. SHR3]
MQRRRFLQLSGVCESVALAGCLTDESDGAPADSASTGTESGTETEAVDENPDSDLTTPVETLWEAYNEADIDGMQAVFHPDSDARPTEDGVSFQGQVTISATTVSDRGGESATVEADLVYETATDRSKRTETYELRAYESRWVIWSQGVTSSDSGGSSPPPQIAFEFEYDTSATGGSDDGVLTVTHTAGDTADAALLFLRGSGIVELDGVETDVTVPDTSWSDATGVEDVSAGTSVSLSVTSDCEVSVVWDSSDGDDSTVLTQYDGPDA